MGHRVPEHGSKCRNLHGHRYTIQATCRGLLGDAGEQSGMVVDFGFLKALMMEKIDARFDHRLCLFEGDPLLQDVFGCTPLEAGRPLPRYISWTPRKASR